MRLLIGKPCDLSLAGFVFSSDLSLTIVTNKTLAARGTNHAALSYIETLRECHCLQRHPQRLECSRHKRQRPTRLIQQMSTTTSPPILSWFLQVQSPLTRNNAVQLRTSDIEERFTPVTIQKRFSLPLASSSLEVSCSSTHVMRHIGCFCRNNGGFNLPNHNTNEMTDTIEATLPIDNRVSDEGRRSKVTQACSNCKRSHLSCDTGRPCKRCVQRKLSSTCTDSERKKRGRKPTDRDDSPPQPLSPSPVSKKANLRLSPSPILNPPFAGYNYLPSPTPHFDTSISNVSSLLQLFRQEQSQAHVNANPTLVVPKQEMKREHIDQLLDQLRSSYCMDSPFNIYSLAECHIDDHHARDPYYPDRTPSTEQHLIFLSQNAKLRGWQTETSWLSLKKSTETYRQIKREIMSLVGPEQVLEMREAFSYTLAWCKNGAACSDVPCIIWGHHGSVEFVNSAFVDLTGFCERLPSGLDRHLLLDLFQFETGGGDAQKEFEEKSTVMLPIQLRIWSNRKKLPLVTVINPLTQQEERFVDGTLCVSMKRDSLNIPNLFYAQFLPSPDVLKRVAR
ncbi:hypothetical protein PROFUN_03503 [Planoprotostelium fungivorum]|uniref:Zn(2)-C6 fungal-type domain-containing protein n=1 Tax=Planoprotostelium fungivorum TaxID=1890364 RepID=A0A2P6MN99_9EUKA|nr:hypothetical protein PROFUN_03503 [Planoprotostelium fungivorum]